jgi:hypothetical protein
MPLRDMLMRYAEKAISRIQKIERNPNERMVFMKVKAYLHSLKTECNPQRGDFGHQMVEVDIIRHISDNDVVAEYMGVRYRAIFNIFASAYFVDDVYGKID